MGSNHIFVCFQKTGMSGAEIKFSTDGGLENYDSVRLSDLLIIHQDAKGIGKDFPWIEEFDDRCYNLYAWLADVRGSVMPMANADLVRERTDAFIEWMDARAIEGDTPAFRASEYAPEGSVNSSDFKKYPLSLRLYLDGQINHMFPLEFLLNFNYDQVAQMEDYSSLIYDEKRYKHVAQKSVPHPDGKTYREIFHKGYFKFLEDAKQAQIDAVMFSIN